MMNPASQAKEQSLGPDEVREIFAVCLGELAKNRDYLDELDQVTGDGDHGSTMHRGAGASLAALKCGSFATVNAVFEAIGSAMMTSMGGASGILFGVWFRAAKFCPAADRLNYGTLRDIFERGLAELGKKSSGAIGDKTLLDALIPATAAFADGQAKSLTEALESAAGAAIAGAGSTIGLLPRLGRAATLGERGRDAKDPGAATVAILFDSFAREVAKRFSC